MITEKITIADKVNVNYIKTDKFKTNLISFDFIAPVDEKTVAFNAMIPLILLRGCRNYPSQAELNKRMQYLYSVDIGTKNDKNGEFQMFGFDMDFIDNKYAQGTDVTGGALDLLCDIIFEPYLENGLFSREYLESEKINLIDTIEAEINNKSRYANSRCLEEMQKGTVYAVKRFGTVKDVEAITVESLYEAYKEALSKYPVEIYVVGDLDFSSVVNKLKERFSKIERHVIELKKMKLSRKAKEATQLVEEQNVNQGKLVLGFRTGKTIEDDDYYLSRIFNEIFGASPTSKLFMNVREKMSLCYYCRSIMGQRVDILLVSSGIKFENKEIAEKAIIEQLDAIKNGEISSEELENAKRSLKNVYLKFYDSPSAMQSWALTRGLSSNKDLPLDEAEKIEKATIEEISEYAKGITLDTVYFLKGEDIDG